MLAALPCSTTPCLVHAAFGYAVVGGFALMLVWGGVALLVKRDPTAWFWRLLGALQVVVIIQIVAGVVLFAVGRRAGLLHVLYGSVFPGVVLVVAHVLGRGMKDERDTLRVFTVASFLLFGLTLRALTTGLGLP